MINKTTKKFRIPYLVIIEIVLIIAVVVGIGAYFAHRHIIAMNQPPVFSVTAENDVFSVKATEEDFLFGVEANDKEDGNVTDSIIIESISQLIDGNTRTITYVAFDKNNNVTKFERDIKYSDYESPKFTNNKTLYSKQGEVSDIISQLKASDVIDGDISNQIKLEVNYVVTGVPGKYPIKASVTNSCGDVVTKNFVVVVTGED